VKPAGKATPKAKITVLICALNEEKNLPYVLPKIPKWVDETILVDGHSTDRTVEVAKKLRPETKVLYQPGKGKQDAKIYGIKQASGDIIVLLDADGSNDPEEMHKFIEPLLNGYDFAKGSRFLEGYPNIPRHRRFGNKMLVWLTNIIHGTKYSDVCSGYNAFWKRALEGLKPSGHGSFMDEPMLNINIKKLGLKVIEVPHRDTGRHSGESKFHSLAMGWWILKIIIRERFRG